MCSHNLQNTNHYDDLSNQQDAAKFVLLILVILLYMFRTTVSPIFICSVKVVHDFHNLQNTIHYDDLSNQQDAAKFVLLILVILLYMFRATVSPILRSTLTVYTAFWNNVPTLLSAADRMELVPSKLCHRSAADSRVGTLFQKAVYTVEVLLRMGETVA